MEVVTCTRSNKEEQEKAVVVDLTLPAPAPPACSKMSLCRHVKNRRTG